MFAGYTDRRFTLQDGVVIHGRIGGSGAPLVLLHGHPQSHVMWHRIAEPLAQRFSVVALDLRGYGDSSRPPSDGTHRAYSKRAMAQDVVDVMTQLGHARFAVCAHDRGARVAHRLGVDHASRVRCMLLLDIAPTLAMYRLTDEAFARAYWHWFFLIQPPPVPERLIESDPRGYLRSVMGSRHAGLAPFTTEALAEYERCISTPGSAHAICEDYRASATIDLDHDRADLAAGIRLHMPLRVLWGAHGTVGRCFDVLQMWRDVAGAVDGRALDCGHYVAEERPDAVLDEVLRFIDSAGE